VPKQFSAKILKTTYTVTQAMNAKSSKKTKMTLFNSRVCPVLYLQAACDWEYIDSGSLASVVAWPAGNPSCMGSVVHQTLQKFNTQHHQANCIISLDAI